MTSLLLRRKSAYLIMWLHLPGITQNYPNMIENNGTLDATEEGIRIG